MEKPRRLPSIYVPPIEVEIGLIEHYIEQLKEALAKKQAPMVAGCAAKIRAHAADLYSLARMARDASITKQEW